MDWSQGEKNKDLLNEQVYVPNLGKILPKSTWVNLLAAQSLSEMESPIVEATPIFSLPFWESWTHRDCF